MTYPNASPRAVAVLAVLACLGFAGPAGAQHFRPPKALHADAAVDGAMDHDSDPVVATDGTVWVVVSETRSAPGSLAGDRDLLVTRSTDAGASWSAPSALNSDAAVDTAEDSRPRLAYGDGVWLAVWQTGSGFAESDIRFSRSTDGGLSWSAAAPLNTNAATDSGDDDAPDLATDGAGTWVVAWSSEEDLAGAGTDFDIFVSRSSDGGATWSAPALLDTNAADPAATGRDDDVHLATDGVGSWVAAWSSQDTLGGTIGSDRDVLFARSVDDGVSWSPVSVLHADAASDGSAPDYVSDLESDGATFVAALGYHADGNFQMDLRTTRSTDAGVSWETPVGIDAGPGEDTDGVDAVGASLVRLGPAWVVVWGADERIPNPPGGPTITDSEIRFAASFDAGASWSPEDHLDPSVVPVLDGGSDIGPEAAAVGGRMLVVWSSAEEYDGLGSDQDVLVSRGGFPAVPAAPSWLLVAGILVASLAAPALRRQSRLDLAYAPKRRRLYRKLDA